MLLQLFTVQFPTIHLAARQAHPGRVWALPIRICDLLVHLLFSLLVHHHHRWQQTVHVTVKAIMRLWYFLLYSSFLTFYNALSTNNKEQTGYVSVSNSNRIQVNLECQSRLMAIHIRFNSSITPWFTDWIVVGDSNRPECRIKGDGSLEYLIEIPLHGDQCGTVKIAPNTFETFIGVKKTPNLILDGDDLLKTRCVYGAPQIQQPVIPSLPATQRQAVLPFLTEPTPFEVTARTNISASFSQIYLITGISLLLIGLCVLYACLYYCFRRRQRKNKQNKTQHLLVSGPEIISRPDSSMAAESSRKIGGHPQQQKMLIIPFLQH
ncbi:hypothetical protein T4E_10473 [Trichinella pseudospiralis]|uniref:ZP domain-containing protein n=1 Tax=Trichinella pseudospiralis TaxID=6337 RepID=A0A0V0XTX5_TRIPS|nr:hypothetical protein T4E_10473 [Trichinella pseudospiralis]